MRELRDEAADRIPQSDLSFLDQHEHGGTGDRLGLRRNAEDCIGAHATSRFLVCPAYCPLVNRSTVAQNQSDCACNFVSIDVALKSLIDTSQSTDVEAVDDPRRRYVCRGLSQYDGRREGENEEEAGGPSHRKSSFAPILESKIFIASVGTND